MVLQTTAAARILLFARKRSTDKIIPESKNRAHTPPPRLPGRRIPRRTIIISYEWTISLSSSAVRCTVVYFERGRSMGGWIFPIIAKTIKQMLFRLWCQRISLRGAEKPYRATDSGHRIVFVCWTNESCLKTTEKNKPVVKTICTGDNQSKDQHCVSF